MHFQRFNPPDLVQFQQDLAQMARDFQAAQTQGDAAKTIDLAVDLGGMLTTARRESEAQTLLQTYLPIAREYGNPITLGWLLLNLGTAEQYLGHKAETNRHFHEALALARAESDQPLEHYVLHHWGRSLVEDGEYSRARKCFEAALAIRVALNEPRQESTRRAIAALDGLVAGDS